MTDVRQILNDFLNGVGGIQANDPSFVEAFMGYQDQSFKENALSTKVRELIGVGIGCYNRCQYCIVFHVYSAYKAGATREEILDAAKTAIAFGGGPSMAYSATVLLAAVNEFENEFK